MTNLNIFLDLDLNKCGYAIFRDSEYIKSGILKSDKSPKLVEKPTGQLKTQEPKAKVKLNNQKIKIGEWRKDPPTGKWKYWVVKFMNFKFDNDIDRAEYVTSQLIDIIAILDLGEINKINLYIEDSNSNHRKLEYIGMVKTYLWEGIEYKFKENDNFARLTLDDIFNVNVSSIKNKLKTAYATLIRKQNINVDMEKLIQRDSKYLSEQIVKITLCREDIENDEADAINMMFVLDKLWYLRNLRDCGSK